MEAPGRLQGGSGSLREAPGRLRGGSRRLQVALGEPRRLRGGSRRLRGGSRRLPGTVLGGEIQGRGWRETAGGGILDPPKALKSKKITKTLKLKLLVNSRKHD